MDHFGIFDRFECNWCQFLVTLIEILPKEKKQKEEKSIVLGQASVDMMSMLRGLLFELHFSGKLSAAFAC